MSQFSPISQPVWSVTNLTRYLRDLFESDELLQDVWVQGEISNLSRPPSGHIYFTLKDSAAALRCIVWRNTSLRLPIQLREGLAVEIHGSLGIYEAAGQYQLYADTLRPAGEGRLFQQFLQIKALLEAEGLFDADRKRPLPLHPRRIGIVTSSSGAALRDILNTLQRRYPLIEVILAHTTVQGVEAPGGIISALQSLNQFPGVEVIILARGGGSIEDLAAFNDEGVARAISASTVPVVSGVGHEIDFTIADFVSDIRAPTPTAAAELVSPDRQELLSDILSLSERLKRQMTNILGDRRRVLSYTHSRLTGQSPAGRVRSQRQRVDDYSRRLSAVLNHRIEVRRLQLQSLANTLASLSPLSILRRGFALLTDPDGRPISHATQTNRGAQLSANLQDGVLKVTVHEIDLKNSPFTQAE